MPGFGGISYRERLDRLGLFTLVRWRLQGDSREVYTIMRNIERVFRIRKQSEYFIPRMEKKINYYRVYLYDERGTV